MTHNTVSEEKMIPLTEDQQRKITNSKNYHDVYFVDVLLKNGEVKYNLSAREKKALVPTSTDDPDDYRFENEDIADIRPHIGMISRILDPWKKKH